MTRRSALQPAHAEGHVAQRNLLAAQLVLVAEQLDRQKAWEACEQAIAACHKAEVNLQTMMVTQQAQTVPPPVEGNGRPKAVGSKPKSPGADNVDREPHTKASGSSTTMEKGFRPKQTRRRGRPTKVGNQKSEIVEWWKPGWQKKIKS